MADGVARVAFACPATPWLRALPPAARFVFRGDDTVRSAAANCFGSSLPVSVGRTVTHGSRAALALGPDEQLLIVPAEEGDALARRLAAALVDRPHSLVDVSHRQVAIELHGEHAEWLLAAGCPLPLDLAAFPIDACTRTVFAKAGVMLWRTQENAFRIEIARSYAGYVVELLREVAHELPAHRR